MEKYNLIIDHIETTGSSVEEPVTVQEAKDWMRLEGFIDDEASSTVDFDDDNDFIEMLITSARKMIEKFTGLSIIQKDFQVELTNLAGNIKLPFGPVIEVDSVINSGDEDETEIDFTTSINKAKLKTPCLADIVVSYSAGFTEVPEWVNHAILTEVAYRYIHRGDEELRGLCNDTLIIVSPYKEVDTWLA